MLWDIFCRVIDNYGDIGVTLRLSAELARRGQAVRLWVDDASALDWMAPGALGTGAVATHRGGAACSGSLGGDVWLSDPHRIHLS